MLNDGEKLSKDEEPQSVAKDLVRKIAGSGSAARVHYALSSHPEGLSIQDIAEITGLKKSTIYVKGVRELFNCQMLEEIRRPQRTIYRLIPRAGLSTAGRHKVKGLKSSEKGDE